MWKRNLIIFLIFYSLFLCQTSFFTYFEIRGQAPNLVLVFLFLLIFFSSSREDTFDLGGALKVIFAGFFLDIFSWRPIGTSIFFLFVDAIAIKEMLKSLKKTNILGFSFLFFVFQSLYLLFIFGFDYIAKKAFLLKLDRFLVIQFLLNLIIAMFGFFVFRRQEKSAFLK